MLATIFATLGIYVTLEALLLVAVLVKYNRHRLYYNRLVRKFFEIDRIEDLSVANSDSIERLSNSLADLTEQYNSTRKRVRKIKVALVSKGLLGTGGTKCLPAPKRSLR